MTRHAARPRNLAERHLAIDAALIGLSIALAAAIVSSGILHTLVAPLRELSILGSFLAGILFTSVFTTAPAVVILAELSQDHSVLGVSLWGGLGAAVGDFLIFAFFRDRFSADIEYILKRTRARHVLALLKTVRFRWVATLVGTIIIASPLPDEIGLALLGLSRISTAVVLPLTFVLNAGGIYLIGELARALQF